MRPRQVQYFRVVVKAALVASGAFLALWGYATWRVGDVLAPCGESSRDIALVLTGAPGRRVVRAARMYSEDIVERLVISGAGYGGDDAAHVAQQARIEGVPDHDIVIERSARNTRENFAATCGLDALSDVETVAIVTDRPHVLRAYLTANEQCPKWIFCVVPVDAPSTWSQRFGEGAKLLAYVVMGWASVETPR